MRATSVVIALALLPTALAAQARPAVTGEPIRLTMQEAVRRALQTGEEVRLAEAAHRQAHGQVTQAYSAALPELRANLTYTRTFASVFGGGRQTGPSFPPFAPDTTASLGDRIRYLEDEYPNALPRGIGQLFAATPFGRANTYVASLTLTQTLFQSGKVGAGLRGARAYERAATAQVEETRQDVVFRVKQAYLNALFAQRLLDIAEGSRTLSDEQLRRVELNHRVGSSADYDLLRAQVESANQEPQVIAARNQRDLGMLELRRLVNIAPERPVELDAGILAAGDSLPEVDFAAVQIDLASRAALEAAQATVEFRRQAVRVYRADLFPALKFTMNYGGQAYPSGTFPGGLGDFRRDWNASLTLSMPIFDGFRIRGQVAQAYAEVERAELQLAQTRESVGIEVEQARLELARALALVAARRQTVAWAARAHHLASVRYTNGITTALEVSDARLAMQQAQVNEAQATRDYLLGVAALEKALGRPVPMRSPVDRRAVGAVGAVGGQVSDVSR
jgi:outer membrane protein TolC